MPPFWLDASARLPLLFKTTRNLVTLILSIIATKTCTVNTHYDLYQ